MNTKTIILGFADAAGLGTPSILAGPEVSADDQGAIIARAKNHHEFPKGAQRVEQYLLPEPFETAIFISDEVREFQAAGHEQRLAEQEEQRKRQAAGNQRQVDVRFANQTFTEYSRKRNLAIADVAAQQNILAGDVPEADKAGILKRIAELQPVADAAAAVFARVLEARNVVINPKSEPEAIAAALVVLQDPAAGVEPPKAKEPKAPKAKKEPKAP